ncbi:aldo/keto reductase [Sphingomonas immobilis]|uniref:Aldo/keto reductase n=1 Tax=Sphingomonas immobilis TaxID=3063997 RepID=A0ABT9A5V0_9SPHN|nr:aldo/keto reductase [Sphingomonas sp. CA1-15]MDO7844610.1 aldo/keto reductase [Sphingomonas sp. CA1-15]
MSGRPLTRSGAALSRLGLGCGRIGSFNNMVPRAEQEACIRTAAELGVNLFDTADVYGQGDSERTLGRLLGRQRDDIFLVTKLGKKFSAKMRLLRPFKPILKPLLARAGKGETITAQRGDNIAHDFSPARYAAALDASLARLRFDQVDALLLHSPPAAAIRAPGVAEALAALVASGKARYFGISCDDGDALDAALDLPGLAMLELPIDLIAARAADARLAAARAAGVVILAREVIRLQPALAPLDAVRLAGERDDVDTIVIGASRPERLRGLIEAAG